MEHVVKKWGNSLGVRLPKIYADKTGIVNDSIIDISVSDGKIIISPIEDDDLSLDEMVSLINKDNLHSEIKTDIRGKEVW